MLTAIFLVPSAVFIVLYTAPVWLLVAVLAITLLALLEYNNLTALEKRCRLFDGITIVFGLLYPLSVFFSGPVWAAPILVASLFVNFGAGIFTSRDFKDTVLDSAFGVMGLLYIAVPFSYMLMLRGSKDGPWWILFMLSVIWVNDTLAFATGKTIGRHKMCPSVSPKKTWEGAAGGLVSGVVAGAAFNWFFALGLSTPGVVALAVLISVVAMIGDLVESVIKRSAGAKDSGTMVPGHGGVLDRIDSILFSVPVLYYYLAWYAP